MCDVYLKFSLYLRILDLSSVAGFRYLINENTYFG